VCRRLTHINQYLSPVWIFRWVRSWCRPRSASDVPQTCPHSCSVVQLSCAGHPSHQTSPNDAQTLACSLILSRIDYCNAVVHGAPTGIIQKLQRVQNNAARIVLQASRRSHAKLLLHQLHWLPVQQRITHKLAVLTNKVRSTSTSVYLHRRIAERARQFTFSCHSATGQTVHENRHL